MPNRLRFDADSAQLALVPFRRTPCEPYPGRVDFSWVTQCDDCGSLSTAGLNRLLRLTHGCRCRRDPGRLDSATVTERLLLKDLIIQSDYDGALRPVAVRCSKCGADHKLPYNKLVQPEWRCSRCTRQIKKQRVRNDLASWGWEVQVERGLDDTWTCLHTCGLVHEVWVENASRMVSPCCPRCAQTGFSVDKPGWLYVVTFPDIGMTKIGISNNPYSRFSNLRALYGQLKVAGLYGPHLGQVVKDVEGQLLADWSVAGLRCDLRSQGATEMAPSALVDLPVLLDRVTMLLPEEVDDVELDALRVAKATYKEVAPFLMSHHYSGKCPPSRFYYVLLDGNTMVGVAAFGRTSRQGTPKLLWKEATKENIMELRRLALASGLPANTGSWFVSRCLKLLPNKCEMVVSFADPFWDHHGGIYQAANFVYTGLSKPSYHYEDANGVYINKSSLRNKEGMTEKQRVQYLGLFKIPDPPKYRYVFPRSKQAATVLEALRLPYPKPDQVPTSP